MRLYYLLRSSSNPDLTFEAGPDHRAGVAQYHVRLRPLCDCYTIDAAQLGSYRPTSAHSSSMWLVRLALRRPYTFVVAALLVAILGVVTLVRMPTDIFPEIDIPVISVIFNYGGMAPDDMEKRVVGGYERILTTTVNDIEHIESQSLLGIGLVKIFFQPGAKIEAATAQVTAVSQTAIRFMPPGMQPPLIIRYSASNVPVVQLLISSETLPEQQLFDQTVNVLRPQLITVPGIQIPYPYGGKQRQIMVDLDPDRLSAWNISPGEVSTAINNQNLILPSGTVKIGKQEYQVRLNGSPSEVSGLNDLPVQTVNGITVKVSDVAHVRDGFSVQTNVVHSQGTRSVLLSILKSGGASTLTVVDSVKSLLPKVSQMLPKELKITPLFDQSIFVRSAIGGVIREGCIAAFLTALMILLFLGSWRSTLVVVTSIPLSILVAVILLYLLGHTLNVMTLGGMALAVGILVDDATVEIENIHRNLHQKKRLVQAILDGAQQIAVPAFVSTLSICIVFVPVVFVSGPAKYLFTPLAMAVVFSMIMSYVLSRTLVPTMVHFLLRPEVRRYGGLPEVDAEGSSEPTRPPKSRIADYIDGAHERFNRFFERGRLHYGGLLAWALDHAQVVAYGFGGFTLASIALFPLIGTDFFPTVDSGQFRLHVRAPAGTRLEETERYFARAEKIISKLAGPDAIDVMLDNMGIPNSGINLSLSDGTQVSPAEGEILVSLKDRSASTSELIRNIRRTLRRELPDGTFFFSPPDISTQVLNFGLSAPIDVQFSGPAKNGRENLSLARKFASEAQSIPGAVDIRLAQVPEVPDLRLNVDRLLASEIGVTQRDIASSLLISLSSSNQTAPNFWLHPQSGINYNIFVQTPQRMLNSLGALLNTPVIPTGPAHGQLLANLAAVDRGLTAANITHYNISPTFDVLLGNDYLDLGSVSRGIRSLVEKFTPSLPRGSSIQLRGQIQSMSESFEGLSYGIIFAVALVYFVMVINFQSWLDPFIILMALPGAAAGILWMLFLTGTTISVPSLMGAIMSIGVATANSILMITFANEQRTDGTDASSAALKAGKTRLRPVIMTALAMIIGMLPMALGIGEGGEQNAPLGRAVIGGLLFATVSTLVFVPVMYKLLRRRAGHREVAEELR